MKSIQLPALLLIACILGPAAAFAADRESRDVVEAISDEFRTRPMRVPMMGLVNAFTKVVRPAGTKHIDIAVFENLSARNRVGRDLPDAIRGAIGASWKPFLQVRSSRDEETVLVYLRQQGHDWKLLVATVEHREATVVQLLLNTDALKRWLVDPLASARHKGWFVE